MPHENTISELLRTLLLKYPVVHIAGIGNFSKIHRQASLDIESHMLYPPFVALSMSADSADKVDFAKMILQDDLVKPKQQKSIQKDLDLKLNELVNFGETFIDGIGTISRGEDGVVAITNLAIKEYGRIGLFPTLDLTPIAASLVDNKVVAPISNLSEPQFPIARKQQTKESSWWKEYLLPLVIISIGGLVLIFGLKAWLSTSPAETKPPEQIKTEEIQAEEDLNQAYAEYLTPAVLANGCEIVVGSFQVLENANNLISQINGLEGAELKTIQTDAGGYRVVVVFDCETRNLKTYLAEIKEGISANSWYLTPNIKSEDL